MSTQTNTLTNCTLMRLRHLESLYCQGCQSDIVDRTLDKIITLEEAQARRELSELEVALRPLSSNIRCLLPNFSNAFTPVS